MRTSKTELKKKLHKIDEKITKLKDQQLDIISEFIKINYNFELGDTTIIKGFTVVIVGFDFEELTYNIKLKCKRVKSNGTLDNIVYRYPYQPYLKRLGPWKGSL